VSTVLELSRQLLSAFARSDLDTLATLTTENVVVFGTDESERWYDRESLFAALEEMRSLGLRAEWVSDPVCAESWAAGLALYHVSASTSLTVRVTFSFQNDLLAHGHFSVAAQDA